MFHHARIKLTLVYLGIIMAISISFSAFIFRMVSYEFQRRIDEIETRLELRRFGFHPPPGESRLFIRDIEEAQKKVLFVLIYTNAVILLFSSISGYFLAGITLRPIEEALEEQKRFVADASHELKTPLTALQTSIEVAIRNKRISQGEAVFVLRDSLSDIKNLTTLTNDLLSLTRYQQDKSKERFDGVDIYSALEESVSKVSSLAKKRGVSSINLSGVHSVVNGNAESLQKLFVILLDNAIKYGGDGKIVDIRTSGNRNSVMIEVEDYGMGIDKKDLPRIFERFYRSDSSRSKSKVSGFGLGLSIAKNIVDKHNGEIKVESEIGKGSKFKVRLPVSQPIKI